MGPRHVPILALVAWLSGVALLLTGCGPRPAPKGPARAISQEPSAQAKAAGKTARPEQVGKKAGAEWKLESSAFGDGERIPAKYTADGENISPPLSWGKPPKGTAELLLICDDPDAPGGTWNHWVVYALAPNVTSLPEGVAQQATVASPRLSQGRNSFGELGWGGPDPPAGKPHRYQFKLQALSTPLSIQPGADRDQVVAAAAGKVIAETTLTGTYGR